MQNASKDQIPRDHFLVVDQWSTGLNSLQTLERGVSLKNESKGERILEDDIKANRFDDVFSIRFVNTLGKYSFILYFSCV